MRKNTRKRLIVITILACLVLVFGIILPQVYTPRENVRRFQKVIDTAELADWGWEAQEPEQLQAVCDLAVLFTPETQKVVGGPREPGSNYTVTTGTVARVISGAVNVGDQLTICEPCSFNDTTLQTFNGYYPMNTGETYLLFLKIKAQNDPDSQFYGMYSVMDNVHGKYALDAQTGLFCRWYLNMAEELEIADMDAIPTYIAKYQLWYEAVRRLYPDVFE